LLDPISQVVYLSSPQQSVAALRAALVQSAQDDYQISLLECLQNYPTAEVQIDLGQLVNLLNQLDSDQSE
jgi:sialic acid synthase SpsE